MSRFPGCRWIGLSSVSKLCSIQPVLRILQGFTELCNRFILHLLAEFWPLLGQFCVRKSRWIFCATSLDKLRDNITVFFRRLPINKNVELAASLKANIWSRSCIHIDIGARCVPLFPFVYAPLLTKRIDLNNLVLFCCYLPLLSAFHLLQFRLFFTLNHLFI